MPGPCIEYRFRFDDDRRWDYRVELDPRTLSSQRPAPVIAPDWVALDFEQCPHCPLDPADTPHCPVALNLADLIAAAGDLASFTAAAVTVETPERCVSGHTTTQRAMGALLGLVIGTSDCPHTRWLRPMARFHLPLASEEETVYRAASMYLLGQYFRHKSGQPADHELEGLAGIYRNLQVLNRALARRLRGTCREDAAVNGIIVLDLLAKALPGSIAEDLDELGYLFGVYTGEGA